MKCVTQIVAVMAAAAALYLSLDLTATSWEGNDVTLFTSYPDRVLINLQQWLLWSSCPGPCLKNSAVTKQAQTSSPKATRTTASANVNELFGLSNTTIAASIAPSFQYYECKACHRFDGIGGLSGGGGTSRLLLEYPPDAQQEILDFLFKPNFGASLHILKVEIGGDAQSTDGSESTHMHSEDDLNFHRGYEWWLLTEAKKRNPNIITYGLPWAFPGWLTEDKGNPFLHLDKVTNYTLQWVKGAREVHGVEIDYLGIWNEIGTSREYLLALRKVLDQNGFDRIKLVSNDGLPQGFLPLLVNDTEYRNAIDVLGFHYPYDDHTNDWILANSFQKPIWSAEESSSYDDLNGAACWARVIASHYVLNNMTADIMWNLLGSYFHGTNWYAASMLTAVQPWSGYYEWEQMPAVWATAHYTQFIQPGWQFLPVGNGSGVLAKGGFYVTLVSPDLKYFTVIVVKISFDHARCTRPHLWLWNTEDEAFDTTINLPSFEGESANGTDEEMQTWYSNLEQADTRLFEKLDPTKGNGLAHLSTKKTRTGLRSYHITLNVTVGSVFTVTNQANVGHKGEVKVRRDPDPHFPLPYSDDFSKRACDNCYSHYLSDQMGAFEIQHVDSIVSHKSMQTAEKRKALVQMTPEIPVMWWQKQKGRGPVTVMGMTEWEDIQVETSFRLPDAATFACVASRTDQTWVSGVSICVNSTLWFIKYGGANIAGFNPSDKDTIAYGNVNTREKGSILNERDWNTVSLTTNGQEVQGVINGVVVTSKDLSIRVGDSGFVALGTSAYRPVQFGHIDIKPVGCQWSKPKPSVGNISSSWSLELDFCTPNGLSADAERFELNANWQIQQLSTGLCVAIVPPADKDAPISLTMEPCVHDHAPQQFRHDYTLIRNAQTLLPLKNELGDLCATKDGQVSLARTTSTNSNVTCAGEKDYFYSQWTLYPNTGQLRISIGYSPWLGGRNKCMQARRSR